MPSKDVILQSIKFSDMILEKYINDMPEGAMLVSPVPGMNSIAWQIGHLISSERGMIEGIKPGSCPPLPEGFDAKHTKETTDSSDPSKFHTKAEYLAVWKAQRDATKAVLASLSDADIDAPAPEAMRGFTPTVGNVLNLTGLHVLMHIGQFVAVRRDQKLPIAI